MLDKDQRNVIVENFQSLLRPIRNIMDCSIAEMAEAIGVTRQTMNNLETRKTGMSQTQYIALAAFIDHYFRQNGRLLPAVQTIIDQEGTKNAADYDTSFRDGSHRAVVRGDARVCGGYGDGGRRWLHRGAGDHRTAV